MTSVRRKKTVLNGPYSILSKREDANGRQGKSGRHECTRPQSLKMIISRLEAGNMGPSYEKSNHNRQNFFSIFGISSRRVKGLRQIHSRRIVIADGVDSAEKKSEKYIEEGDGLLTASTDIVLSVTVADCLPIFLYHLSGKFYGVVHSGWQGTGIISDAVQEMNKRYDVPFEEIAVIMGPGIGVCCYKVDKERAALFHDRWGESSVSKKNGFSLDLRQANINALNEYPLHSITVFDDCTCCDENFGSFRRQGPDRFSRMIALIGYF